MILFSLKVWQVAVMVTQHIHLLSTYENAYIFCSLPSKFQEDFWWVMESCNSVFSYLISCRSCHSVQYRCRGSRLGEVQSCRCWGRIRNCDPHLPPGCTSTPPTLSLTLPWVAFSRVAVLDSVYGILAFSRVAVLDLLAAL